MNRPLPTELGLVLIEDLDEGRQLVVVDADWDSTDSVAHVCFSRLFAPVDGEVSIATTSWAPLESRLVSSA